MTSEVFVHRAAPAPASDDVTPRPIVKVSEVSGSSKVSFDDAVKQAVDRSVREERDVQSITVKRMTATVRDGRLDEYHVELEIACGVCE